MPLNTPRPYDPVEEAAAAMGVANLRPRYFISGSPDATVGLNARYGQAVQQASDLGFDLARRPYQLEQERIQTEAAEADLLGRGVRADRVRNALANRDRIEGILAGLSPEAPDYRAKRTELAKLGADEILGPELGQLDQAAEPYERVRNELTAQAEVEKEYGPKRAAFMEGLTKLNPDSETFKTDAFKMLSQNPWAIQDRASYAMFEDFVRTGYEKEQMRKLRERELLSLDPETRGVYDRSLKEGLDPENALFAAQRARQTKLLRRQAIALGVGQKELIDLGDDPELLADRIAVRQGELASMKQGVAMDRATQSRLRSQIQTLRSERDNNPDIDDAKRKELDDQIFRLTDELLNIGSSNNPDSMFEE